MDLPVNTDTLLNDIRELLQNNFVESQGYRYTRPAPSIYEQQWLWDSCFHSIIFAHYDTDMAKDELRSLVNHRGVDTNGMIPHMIYWDGGGSNLWGSEYVSTITQPPMLAYAALNIFKTDRDLDFLEEMFEPLSSYYRWLRQERDHDGDYLLSIIHPWESGWDASPRWDSLLGLSNPSDEETLKARVALAGRLKDSGTKLFDIVIEGSFHVKPVDFNAIYKENLWAMSEIAEIIHRPRDRNEFQGLTIEVSKSMNAKMWDETSASFWDLAGTDESMVRIPTAASFVTLFSGVPSEVQAQIMVDEMLSSFWPTYPVPTVATTNDALFRPNSYWRGSTWLNVNWFIVKGLRRYGFNTVAEQIVQASMRLIESEGYREYFGAVSGEGLGSKLHSWSGLVLDMRD